MCFPSWSSGAGCQEPSEGGLCLGFPFKQQCVLLVGVKVFLRDSGQMQDAGALQPCGVSPLPTVGSQARLGCRDQPQARKGAVKRTILVT